MHSFTFRKLKNLAKTKLQRQHKILLQGNLKENLKIWDRACFILPFFQQFNYSIYNGRSFLEKTMLKSNYVSFYRFGEFSFTRRLGKNLHIHLEKKKDLRKKKI
jgi:ribosomal protein S19